MTLALADLVKIEALFYRLGVAFDERDQEAYVKLWAPYGWRDDGSGRRSGLHDLRRVVDDARGDPEMSGTRHWPNNLLVDGEFDIASVTLDLLRVRARSDGPEVVLLLQATAALVRSDGTWLFTEWQQKPAFDTPSTARGILRSTDAPVV